MESKKYHHYVQIGISLDKNFKIKGLTIESNSTNEKNNSEFLIKKFQKHLKR